MGGRGLVRLGYAADAAGRGVVYARLNGRQPKIARAGFRVSPSGDDERREVGFAAVRAIVPVLRKQLSEVEIQLDDATIVADLNEHRELPASLFLPYVRARCALNAFKACAVVRGEGPNDLAARALAEVSLRVAA